ncbi:MAG: sulfatase [Planctomycetota bacterium]
MALGFAITSTLCLGVVSEAGAGRPNVVFFAVDDMCDWAGPLGYEQAVTPNLDRLARRGVTFTNAHTAGIYCAPSRTAIFTGRHASTTGCYTTAPYFFVDPDIRPLQVAFSDAGYRTYGAGKLFHHPEGMIDRRGWTEFFLRSQAQRESGWPLNSWEGDDVPFNDRKPYGPFNAGLERISGGLFLEWAAVPDEDEARMADTQRIEYACDTIRSAEEPFFVGVGLYAPHFPNYAPQKYFDLYDRDAIEPPPYLDDDLDDVPEPMRRQMENRRRRHQDELVRRDLLKDALHGYLASISYADAMLGRVLDALDESGQADDTVVVFWSDHGYHHGEKGNWGKHTLWERTSSVPFLWAGPGIARGEVVDTTASLIDMFPTFVDLCGLEADDTLEGVTLADTLRDPASAEDRFVLLPSNRPDEFAVFDQDWRYIRYQNGTEEFYDLTADAHEWHNLANDPEYASTMRAVAAHGPTSFAPMAPDKPKLKLIVEGESYRWELKPAAKPKKKPAGTGRKTK